LLWRLRRATAIETDLLRIQAGILCDRRNQTRSQDQLERSQAMPLHIVEPGIPIRDEPADNRGFQRADQLAALGSDANSSQDIPTRDLAHCLKRLARFDNGLFERLGRYETALWRQMVQTHFLLQAARRR